MVQFYLVLLMGFALCILGDKQCNDSMCSKMLNVTSNVTSHDIATATSGETSDYGESFDDTTPPNETEEEQPCHDALSLQLPNASLLPNKSLLHDGLSYPQGTYWKAGDSFFGCPCQITSCLRRCGVDHNTVHSDLQLEILHENERKVVNAYTHFKVIHGSTCDSSYDLDPQTHENDNFTILSNGTLWLHNDGLTLEADEFCINMDNSTIVVNLCFDDTEQINPPVPMKFYIYPVIMLISVLFLLVTIIAYANAPEIRNLHGRCVVCHSLSMLFGYIGLATMQIAGQSLNAAGCRGIALATYYTLLATFFWLNVMCFDIWWTFSGFRQMRGSTDQTKLKKFIIYSSYSWGVPLIMTIIALSVDDSTGDNEALKPGFGKNRCWFQDFWPEFLYFYGPVCIILILNLYFFATTAVKILRLKRETAAMLKQGDNRKHNSAESQGKLRYKLYLKLFLVMGLSWVFEVFSFAIGGPEEIWYITDIFNTLQGVFIFIFCVWFTRVRNDALRKLFPKFARRFSIKSNKSVIKSSDESEGMTMKTVTEDVN